MSATSEEAVKKALFEVSIKIKGNKIVDAKNLSYDAALTVCTDTLNKYPNDDVVQSQLKACIDSFGFSSYGGDGYDFTISASIPIINLKDEKQRCPRRDESPMGMKETDPTPDHWQMRGSDKCCSYCGSLHPNRVIELVKQFGFGILERSTKGYKWYINRPDVPNAGFGGIKYYRQHDTDLFINDFNALVNATPIE